MSKHEHAVLQQFDPRAGAYLTSAVHAGGPDLQWVQQWLDDWKGPAQDALDAGCGAGHLAFRLASRFRRVVAADPSPSMVRTAVEEARRRGLDPVEGLSARAANLPCADGSFDLVATRFSAHHWYDLPASLHELRRVLRPGGQLLLIDLLGEDSPLVDTHLQAIELLRDPSHVRDRTTAEWLALLQTSGFRAAQMRSWPLRLEFTSWTQRMRVPDPVIAQLRSMLAQAPEEVRQALQIEPDGSFTARVGLFVADAG
ncbi:MAG: class I SAM-dependent methyltransferase [Steroidobacteraceae bacterium]